MSLKYLLNISHDSRIIRGNIMTVQQEKGLDLVHKIIMWIAMVCVVGIVGYFMSTVRSQAFEIENIKAVNASQTTEIEVLKANYKNIDMKLGEILTQIKDNNRKLDRHIMGNKDG